MCVWCNLRQIIGFQIQRGIEIDPSKIKAITEMPVLRTVEEVRDFFGYINYIDHFIAKFTTTCEPLFKNERMV